MTAKTDESKSVYEGMFLFPQSSTSDLQAAVDMIKSLITKSGGELISLRKWDERRLAYEINGNKRGVYFLTYFTIPRANMSALDRACTLNEQLLRTLFTRADHISLDQMQAADGQAQLADEIKLRKESPQQQRQDAREAELQAVGAGEDDASIDDTEE